MKIKRLLTLCVPFLGICLSSCSGASHHQEKEYLLNLEYKTDFKILQLTDLHLGLVDDLDLHFKFMDLTIKDAKADLIVITGDVFTFATDVVLDKFLKFIDGYKIPWAVTFGNHDEQVSFSFSEYTKKLSSYSPYCVFKDIPNDDVYGYANYVINLNKDNKAKYQLYVLDSNRYRYSSSVSYDHIHQDQIDWYERMVNYSTKENGSVVPSLSFFHIPVPEFKEAWEEKDNGGANLIFGSNKEKCSIPQENSGYFAKAKELGSCKAMFVGHDHVNTSEIMYQGIDLVYGIHSTDRVYYDEEALGGLTITIHDDDSFTIDRIFHHYKEVR